MEPNPGRVTTLELFFDLVFVFVITQLTSVLVADLTWRTLFNVAVMLGLIFYMYGGYAWLTNAVPARGRPASGFAARRDGGLHGDRDRGPGCVRRHRPDLRARAARRHGDPSRSCSSAPRRRARRRRCASSPRRTSQPCWRWSPAERSAATPRSSSGPRLPCSNGSGRSLLGPLRVGRQRGPLRHRPGSFRRATQPPDHRRDRRVGGRDRYRRVASAPLTPSSSDW